MVKMKLHKIGPLHSTITRVFNQNILIMTPWGTCATEAEVELDVSRFPQIKIRRDQISIAMLKFKENTSTVGFSALSLFVVRFLPTVTMQLRLLLCLVPLTIFQDLHNTLNRTVKVHLYNSKGESESDLAPDHFIDNTIEC